MRDAARFQPLVRESSLLKRAWVGMTRVGPVALVGLLLVVPAIPAHAATGAIKEFSIPTGLSTWKANHFGTSDI
jgi:hypothetical protein